MPRPEVKWFSEQMERVLKENDYKGGWGNCTTGWLFDRVLDETDELKSALQNLHIVEPDKVIKECVDVANYAMMIADKVRSND